MAKRKQTEEEQQKFFLNFDRFVSPLAASFELKQKQLRFAEEYIATRGDIVAAAKACDITPASCYVLLRNEKVATYIKARIEQLEKKPEIKASKDDVLQEMAVLAFSDMSDYLSWGKDYIMLRDSNTLPPGASKAISEIIFTENEYGTLTNRRVNRQVRIRLHDKKSALDSLAKMLGMFDSSEKQATAEDVASKIREFQYESSLNSAIPKPEDYFNDDDEKEQLH
jgi:phage terminase small subunit